MKVARCSRAKLRSGVGVLWLLVSFMTLASGEAAAASPPSPTEAQIAADRNAALAAARADAAAHQSDGLPSVIAGGRANPLVIEPINTTLGPFYADGCEMYAMFGNFAGVAFGKSEVYDDGAYCGVSDQILAYAGGSYSYGNVASANAGTGWTNPQSQVSGYSVLSEYVTVCNSSNQCTNYEFDAV